MTGSSESRNQDRKIYEMVNKYYYDIESITVYFKSYCIFSKNFKHRRVALLMLCLMSSIAYHAVMIVIMESSILQDALPIYVYKSKYLGWMLYFVSLAVYVVVLLFIDSRKTNILESKYGSKDIQLVQDKWVENNLPENVNSFSLVSKSTEWFQSYHKVNHNDFLSTGKLLQNSKINIIMKNVLAAMGLSISAKFLGGAEVSEVASKYPNETVLIAFNLLLLIFLCLFLYSIFQVFGRRFVSAIDGRNSKSSYRFNIFNRMLLHHVTLKDFKD